MTVIYGPRRTEPGTYDAWTTVLRSVDPRFAFTDPPFRHSLPMALAFAAARDRPIAEDGNLTLTGTVSYGAERAAAEQAVAALTGVRNVRDDVEISYDDDLVDVDLHVQEALSRSALVPDDSDVKVATDGSIITLTGHVHTWAEHDAVVGAAWMARGAVDVNDELQITG